MPIGMKDGDYALKIGAYNQAFEIFMMLANAKEDPAFYKLCKMVLDNQLSEENLKILEDNLLNEVELNNASAAYNLAILRWQGPENMRDTAKAVELLEKACAMNLAEAFIALANLYSGEESKHPLATGKNIIHLLTEAIERGSTEAVFQLGKVYYEGKVTARDDALAFQYFFMAGRLGHQHAQRALLILQAIHPQRSFREQEDAAREMIHRIELTRGPFN